ncbi:MAG: hypothetical protein E2P02_28550 [Acidobacteria bacterium]|nr:MAG: hypothetical protein E2P02_28550 [Acidobacteriota bacterium]
MRESFKIQLIQDGTPIRVKMSEDESGLVLKGETDASPRQFYLEFDSRSSVTALRMRTVQRIHGWRPWEFRLKVTVSDDGCLQFRGANERALPSGHYWIKPKIEDLELAKGKRIKLRIKEGEETLVPVAAKEDPRRVELTTDIAGWDDEMRRVATAPDSKLDNKRIAKWLASDAPRERRKACLLNVLAALRGRELPTGSLLHPVQDVFFAGVDRVYTRAAASLYAMVVELAEGSKKRFYDEGSPKSKIHLKLLDRAAQRFGVDPKDFKLRSFRAEGGPSLQIVFGVPKGVAAVHLAEMDIDLGNPLQDVKGFVVHLGELLDSGRTDHLSLREKLAKGKTQKFLYYRVRKT